MQDTPTSDKNDKELPPPKVTLALKSIEGEVYSSQCIGQLSQVSPTSDYVTLSYQKNAQNEHGEASTKFNSLMANRENVVVKGPKIDRKNQMSLQLAKKLALKQ